MNNKKRLRLSQLAHKRLAKFHKAKSNGDNVHFVKMNYHSSVEHRQEKLGRKLSRSEKEKVYNDVILTFY